MNNKLPLNQQINDASARITPPEIQYAPIIIRPSLNNADSTPPRKAGARTIQISIRMTPEEHERLCKKIALSGKPQGEYVRQMALCGKIISRKISDCDDILIDEIASMRSMLGRLGGLMKMIRNAYEIQNVPNEKAEAWMAESSQLLQSFKERLQNLEVHLNGDH